MSALGLDAGAFVTIAEARRFVFRNEDESSRDGLLIDAVNMVCASIASHCRREFTDTTADPGPDVRTFSIGPGGWVDLSPYDLRELDEVIRYTDYDADVHETLAATSYRLFPAGRTPEGTFLHLKTAEPTLCEASPGFGYQCTVAGEWGMESTPAAVTLAALTWVKNIVENPGGYSAAAYDGYTLTPETDFETATSTPAGMPAAVRHRLRRFRRFPVMI